MPTTDFFSPVGLLLTVAVAAGCSDTLPPSPTGDPTRRLAPPPACAIPLPSRGAASSATRTIREDAWWKVLFPAYDEKKGQLPEASLTCEGRPVFRDPTFDNAAVRGGAWPIKPQEGDVVQGTGLNKLRLMWFRTHDVGSGVMAGPLAMVRSLEDDAEVYAIGSYRGNAERAKLRIERMGSDLLPTVQDDGCVNVGDAPCETILHVYLPYRGELKPAATFTLEKVAYAQLTEPGVLGKVSYHLVTTPIFGPTSVSLSEQITVLDADGRQLRRAELTRVFTPGEDRFDSPDQPLWDRIVRVDAKMTPAELRKN